MSSIARDLIVNLTLQYVVPHLLREAAKLAARPAIVESPHPPVGNPVESPRLRVLPSLASRAVLSVVSQTPGRIRVRVDGLRANSVLAEAAVAPLRSLAGVRLARANQLTGTVLVEYDPAAVGAPDILAALDRCGVLHSVGSTVRRDAAKTSRHRSGARIALVGV